MDLPTGLLADIFQRGQKQAPILIIPENVLLVILTIHDVVNRPGILDAQFAGHKLPES